MASPRAGGPWAPAVHVTSGSDEPTMAAAGAGWSGAVRATGGPDRRRHHDGRPARCPRGNIAISEAAKGLPGRTDHRDLQPHELRRRHPAGAGLQAPRPAAPAAGDVRRVPGEPVIRPPRPPPRFHLGRSRGGGGRALARRRRRCAGGRRGGGDLCRGAHHRDRSAGRSEPRRAPSAWPCAPARRSCPWRWSVPTSWSGGAGSCGAWRRTWSGGRRCRSRSAIRSTSGPSSATCRSRRRARFAPPPTR